MILLEGSDWSDLSEKRKQCKTQECFNGRYHTSRPLTTVKELCMSLRLYYLHDKHSHRCCCSSLVKLYIVTHFPSLNNTRSLLAPHPTAQVRLGQLFCSTNHHYVYIGTQLALHQAQLQPLWSKEGVESVIILSLHFARRMSASMLSWQRSRNPCSSWWKHLQQILVLCIVLDSNCEV